MVGGTTHQQQQAPQLTQQSSSLSATAHATAPEEDEVLKRNTDCVYFLASPLTCKKGSECEYRHSDIARLNPRDCWYWLNGTCLNPKCAFRHPPLDGLLGSDVSPTMGPPAPAPHATPYVMPKQGVACIFFQKGYCLKGHLCPFLHGPSNYLNPVNNKPTQPVTEPPKMGQQVTTHKQPPLSTRNGIDKKIAPPVMNEPPSSKPNRGYHASNNERIVNGKDAEEYSREPSPGFDVLVHNIAEDVDHVDRDMYREHRRNDRENESDLRRHLSKQRRGSVVNKGTISSRLRGRIKIPGRSMSPTKESNPRVEREIDMERRHLSRVRDRISDAKFSGPKRLSELKSVRTDDEQFSGKRKYPKVEEDLSFEGPKPLSEILKRKRGVNNDNGVSSVDIENKKEAGMISVNKEEEEQKSVSVEFEVEKKNEQVDVNFVNHDEDGLIDEDALLDEELEAYDENRDGEYEYEQMEGEEDYNLDEGEYVEEEDGDEYGKQEGVVDS